MAGQSSLVSRLPAHILTQISHEDWTNDQGRDSSCSTVDNVLSEHPELVKLIGQLTHVDGSPLQKYRGGAQEWKSNGNEAFKIGAWQNAVTSYTKALQYAPHDGPSNRVLLAPLFSNRAAALEKLGETAAAVSDCTRAIEADSQYSKGWYRRGKAKAVLKDLGGAVIDLETALLIENGGKLCSLTGVGTQSADSKTGDKGPENGLRARRGAPVSGSAKQIADELERVRALLPEGGLLKDAEDGKLTTPRLGLKEQNQGQDPQEPDPKAACSLSDSNPSGVEIFHQQGRGRGLQATRVFAPGDIAIFEAPFAAVLLKERRGSHCHHCFAVLPPNPLHCSGCAGPLFCSKTCRHSALGVGSVITTLVELNDGVDGLAEGAEGVTERLQEGSPAAAGCTKDIGVDGYRLGAVGGHAHECGGASWAAILPPDAVLAVRVLARLRREEAGEVDPGGKRHFEIASLCHHLDRLPADDRPALLVLACTTARCAVSAGVQTTAAEVLLTIGRLRANVMAVNDVTFGGAADSTDLQSDSPFLSNGNGSSSSRSGRIAASAQLGATNGRSPQTQSFVISSGDSNGGPADSKDGQSVGGACPTGVTFEQTQLGQALYPTATLLNHSCDPNAAVSFTGNLVTVRAVKRVVLGEELTLSYGPQKGETRTAERRKWLWERYAFVCNCAACAGDQTSDVLMTGFRCPRKTCEGVVPQHSAVGTFRFLPPTFQGSERTEIQILRSDSRPPLATAAAQTGTDLNGTQQTGAQFGVRGGDANAGAGVCSDCDRDPPDVVCAECDGRLLCLECDSHVHQPRSKRRGSHVRERLGGNFEGEEHTPAGQSEGREDATSAKVERDGQLNGQVGSAEIRNRGTQHADNECRFVRTGTSSDAFRLSALSPASGPRKLAQSTGIEQPARLGNKQEPTDVSPDGSSVSKVESGRCTACGTSVDVASALARVEAGWAAATGRMPYLEAAEAALATAREVLHPRNRKLAEFGDHLAEAYAQAGRVEEAGRHCAQSLRILEYHYPRGSLPLAHEYAKLSSLARAAGKSNDSSDMIAKAETIWRAHFGQAYKTPDLQC